MQSFAAESTAVVVRNKFKLSLSIQPLDSGKKIVTDSKAVNRISNQKFPDIIDNQVLVPTPDGTFSYAGR